MNYDKAILIENFDYASPIHVCVTLICDVLFTQLYNHHTSKIKFQELSDGHILIDVLILLGEAIIQNVSICFFS